MDRMQHATSYIVVHLGKELSPIRIALSPRKDMTCVLLPDEAESINPRRLPEGRSRTVISWAVGVTTAPRPEPTLARTLDSLAIAGWERPRLFVEPDSEIPPRFADLPRSDRDEPLGAFANWYLALAELVMRSPRAEAYFMVQDDVIFARGVRPFLERSLWPAANCGAVSIYCPSHYALNQPAGFHLEDRGWGTWAAQALLFSNPSARSLLASCELVNHRHHGPRDGSRNIDCVVGLWCRQTGMPFYVYTPSLAQHIGETSTLYARASAAGRRRATTFIGEDTYARGTPVPVVNRPSVDDLICSQRKSP